MNGSIRHQLAFAVVTALACTTASVALAGGSGADTCGVMGLTPSTAESALRGGATVSPSQPRAGETACTITPTDKARHTTIRVVVVAAESLADRIEGDVYERPSATRAMRGLGSGAVLLRFDYRGHVDEHVWFEAGPFGVEVTSEAPGGSLASLHETTGRALAVARAIYAHLA